MKAIKYDITKASKPAIKQLAHAIDTLAPLCVKRNGSRTGMGDKIHNNGGSKRLLERHAGTLVDEETGKRKPVTAANARMWIRAVEECQRRELDVPVGAPLQRLIATLRKARTEALA